jgi:serine/threonine protein kinase
VRIRRTLRRCLEMPQRACTLVDAFRLRRHHCGRVLWVDVYRVCLARAEGAGALYSKFYVFDALENSIDAARLGVARNAEGMLPYEETKHWICDMLRAALYLQNYKVVHLDIKLDNMLMNRDGRLLFCDLGYAVYLVRARFLCALAALRGEPKLTVPPPHLVYLPVLGACQEDGRTYTMMPEHRFGGNGAHLAPELMDANTVLERGVMVSPDLTKHMVFACGVAIVELIREPSIHPFPGYTTSSLRDPATGRVSYSEAHATGVPSAEVLDRAG